MIFTLLSPFINRVTLTDCITGLQKLPDNSVHCMVTSPPYWALRDYGAEVVSHFPEITFSLFGMPVTVQAWSGQLGHEPDPMMFTAHIVYIFREARRVLRKDGTLWMNFGDSYATLKQQSKLIPPSQGGYPKGGGLKPKDLCGIPWMVAFAMRDDGWYLRQDIIWSKPNPMPESTKDRCTKAHEYIFLFSKSKKYFYDAEAIKTQAKSPSDYKSPDGWDTGAGGHGSFHRNGREKGKKRGHSRQHEGFNQKWDNMSREEQTSQGANKRSVWEVATKPFSDAHFATYPPNLITDCIKAGCPEYVCSCCGAPFVPEYNKVLVPTPKASKKHIIDARDMNADRQDQG